MHVCWNEDVHIAKSTFISQHFNLINLKETFWPFHKKISDMLYLRKGLLLSIAFPFFASFRFSSCQTHFSASCSLHSKVTEFLDPVLCPEQFIGTYRVFKTMTQQHLVLGSLEYRMFHCPNEPFCLFSHIR